MSSTETSSDDISIGNILTLIISTSILLIILFFSLWLYQSSKTTVEENVLSAMIRTKRITKNLVHIKRKELDILAESITISPLLKGSLATGHEKTIVDVMDSLKSKHDIDNILILKNKRLVFSDSSISEDKTIKELVSGKIIGKSQITIARQLQYTVLVIKELTKEILNDWSLITQGQYVAVGSSGDLLAQNTKTIMTPEILPTSSDGQRKFDGIEYYFHTLSLFKNTLKLVIMKEKSLFWIEFTKNRNSLVVLGVILFFVGVVISIIFSKLFERYIDSHQRVEMSLSDSLLEEINDVKSRLFRNEDV